MTIGTASFNHLSINEMRAMYCTVREQTVTKTGETAAAFDARIVESNAWLGLKAGTLGQARNYLATAFWALEAALTVKHFSPPSEETLNWGGFLGGEWHSDKSAGEAACLAILRG